MASLFPGASRRSQRAWAGAGKSDLLIWPHFRAPFSSTPQERAQEPCGVQPCVCTLACEAASAGSGEGPEWRSTLDPELFGSLKGLL